MRKALSLILALAMALTVCVPLGCAEAFTPLETDRLSDLCVGGDVLYLLYEDGEVVSRPLEGGDLTLLGKVYNTNGVSADIQFAEDAVAIDRLFVSGGSLWGVSLVLGAYYRLTDESGAFAPVKQPATLDITSRDGSELFRMVMSFFEQGGYVYLTGINASNAQIACRISLETGERKDFETKPYLMAPWSDGLVAAYMYNIQTMQSVTSMEALQAPVDFALFDPEGDRLTASFTTTVDGLYGGYSVNAICSDNKSIFYATGSRVYGMDMQTGATRLSAYTGEGILSGMSGASVTSSAVYANGKMLMIEGTGVQVIGLDTASTSGVLRIFGELGSDAHKAFVQNHPDIPVDVGSEYTADIETITQAMVADAETFDVLVLNYSQMPVDRLVKKGYCLSLEGYDEIMSRVNQMMPKYVEGLYTDGHLYAVPCNMEASGICYNTELWEQLGLTEDDLPKTYAEFYDFLANYVYDYGEDNPDIAVFDFSMAREMMYTLLVNQYIEYCVRSGVELRFDTPVFRELMQGFAAIDFNELTQVTGETQSFYNAKSLFNLYTILSDLGTDQTNKKPLLLSMAKGEEPFVSCTLTVLAINPRTKLLDNAVKYVAEYLDHLSPTSANITLFPNHNEPVIVAGYEQAVQQLQEEIAKQETQLQSAAEENKPVLQQTLEITKDSLEQMELYKYSVSPERIADYRRTLEPHMAVQGQSVFVGGGSSVNEVNSLLLRYLDGDLVLDQLVKELDGRVRLMELEDR